MLEKEDENILTDLLKLDEKEKNKELVYNYKFQRIEKNHLQSIADNEPINLINYNLETQRCEKDVLYCLFKRPHTITELLITKFHELIVKKYSPDLALSRVFNDAMEFLLKNKKAHPKILTFFILLIVCREKEAQKIIQDTYKLNLWPVNHLDKFVNEFSKIIYDETFKFPFGESNIIQIIHQCVNTAELIYMSM